jgi:hypothetical protein
LEDEDGTGGAGEEVVTIYWVGERSRHVIGCYEFGKIE